MEGALEAFFKPLVVRERKQLDSALVRLRDGSYPLLALSYEMAYPPA
jgi:hypothetical protein